MVLAVLLAGCGTDRPAANAAPRDRPNVVFVLTDDLTGDLIQYMPNVQRLQAQGTTFDNYIVSASLCCPSRASILTGALPHNTGVRTNIFPHGGLFAYRAHHNSRRTWARRLKRNGYRTGLFGKYLNGYPADIGGIPPGWTDWAATNKGYFGFDYTLNVDGVPTSFGDAPSDYMTDVIAMYGLDAIDQAATEGRPFVFELAPFTPHRPAVPAPQDADAFPGLGTPRPASFNRQLIDAPPWLANRAERPPRVIAHMDALYRRRAQSVLAIDAMLGRLIDRLGDIGELDNTYVIFSSDNGYHIGEHRLLAGKLTAFDTDIRVPLIVRGPGVPAGRHVAALVQNTDLAPTFEALAGLPPRANVDGRSLVPILHGARAPADWRQGALVEHRHTPGSHGDPDAQTPASGDPPSYEALRGPHFIYVEYRDGEREYYDLRADPEQLHNVYRYLRPERRASLSTRLARLVSCRGAEQCATAPASPAVGAGRDPRPRSRR